MAAKRKKKAADAGSAAAERRRARREERRRANREQHDRQRGRETRDLRRRPLRILPWKAFETEASREVLECGYSEALGEWVCSIVAINVASTVRMCEEIDDFPNYPVLQRWRRRYPAFAAMYEDAKAAQGDLMADETIDIADTQELGEIVTEKPNGVEIKTEDMLGHRRLQIETRRWYAGRLNPKYSDKLTLDGGLANTNINADVDSLDDASLEAIARAGKPALTKPTTGKK